MKLRKKPLGVGNLIEISSKNKVVCKNLASYTMIDLSADSCDLSKS